MYTVLANQIKNWDILLDTADKNGSRLGDISNYLEEKYSAIEVTSYYPRSLWRVWKFNNLSDYMIFLLVWL